jgi:hypothetical protein
MPNIFLRRQKNVRAMLHEGGLPSWAWPGGYPILYIDHDGETICPKCANDDDWSDKAIVGYFVHYEGEPEICANCNAQIESAYGQVEP